MMTRYFFVAFWLMLVIGMVNAEENLTNALNGSPNLNVSNETISNITEETNQTNQTIPYNESTLNITDINITNQTINATPIVVCNATQCDSGCVVCSDKKCHEPEFKCIEEITIERFFPNTVSIGNNQINILIKNTGNVYLSNIYIDLSGDGIITVDKIPLEKLAVGEKDYTFTKITASKSGVIDLVLKIYVNDSLKEKKVEQLTVIEEKKPEIKEEENISMISSQLEKLKEDYKEIEEEYQNKKLDGYPVDFVYDKLKETSNYIRDAKLSLLESRYKSAKNDIKLAEDNINSIKDELKGIKKKEISPFEKFRTRIILFGSIAAAIASIFTVWNIFKSHVNAQKIKEVKEKIQAIKEEDKKEDKSEKKEETKKLKKK